MIDTATDLRIDTRVAELIITGSSEALQRWTGDSSVPEGSRLVDTETNTEVLSGLLQEGVDHIMWLGWPSPELTAQEEAAKRLWVLVDEDDVAELQERRGAEIIDQIARLADVRSILVADSMSLEYLSRKLPAQAAKFCAVRPGASLADAVELLRLVQCTDTAPNLLLYRPHQFGVRSVGTSVPSTIVHELCDRTEHLNGSPAQAWHLLGAQEEHRVDGRIKTRNAAWHLASAAKVLGQSVLLTDDLAVAVALAGYKTMEVQIWVLLQEREARQLLDPHGAHHPELARSVRTVLAKGGQLAVCDADVRESLREIPEIGTRVILVGQTGELDLELATDLARTLGRKWSVEKPTTVLLAGHDFKFAGELVQVLERVSGVHVIYDKWEFQHRQSVKQSDLALREADVILCEFASHNAVWYSWHKLPGQRLVVHFHGYELFQDWITEINVANVDVFVFVSDFYRNRVVEELGWPREKTVVVPNMIDPEDLDRPKIEDARFHLGVAGIVPILKRPDRALDLLERLLEDDDRYVLHVRGRNPWDYQWMWRDPVVRDAYEGFYERLTANPRLLQHVAFDAFGPDMGRWFRRIGWMLSPSYRETFHLAPVEGMPGGAVPVVWQRDGAEEIFGDRWVHESTEEAARFILQVNGTEQKYRTESEAARLASRAYSLDRVSPQWYEALFDEARTDTALEDRFDRASLEQRYGEDPTPARLDRLMLFLLKREGDVEAVERIMADYPKQALSASAETKSLLGELRTRRLYAEGAFVRPDRCSGAVYQARTGHPLIVDAVPIGGTGGVPSGALALRVRTTKDQSAREVSRVVAATPPADTVQILADGLVRAARRARPSVLVAPVRHDAAWATVVAARRLGVPAVLAGDPAGDPALPPLEEFDAVVSKILDVTPNVVAEAVRRHAELIVAAAPQRELHDLTVGIIADEFTSRTVSGRCRTVPIHRENAYLQVATAPLDVLFIESAWTGPDKEWFHGIAYYKDERQDIERVIEVARAKGIPVLFWNKEDPVHFKSFAPTAALCDAVFTTDAGRLPAYLKNGDGRRPSVVASLPFYAEPRLHNPLPGTWQEKRTISYAGTYYGQRFAERSAELDRILSRAAFQGLTIYDRQKNLPNSPYHFPKRYDDYIEGGLSYDEVLEAYKAHPVHINVNSVNDSPTMFSRRVVEIAGSGAVVVSGRGRGLVETLPEVPTSTDAEVLGEIMDACMTDRHAWASLAWDQLRSVRRSHRADQALTLMLRSAGLTLRIEADVPWTARVDVLDADIAASLIKQTMPPAAVAAVWADDAAAAYLNSHGINTAPAPNTEWWIEWEKDLPDTWAEDLLYASLFAPEEVGWIGARSYTGEQGILHWEDECSGPVFRRSVESKSRGLTWLLPGAWPTRKRQEDDVVKEFDHND